MALHLALKENVWAPIRMAMDDEAFCRYFRLFQVEGETAVQRDSRETEWPREKDLGDWVPSSLSVKIMSNCDVRYVNSKKDEGK